MIIVVLTFRDTAMAEFTPKTSSDAKKTYAHPDVIDLLSTSETETSKLLSPYEDSVPGYGPLSGS